MFALWCPTCRSTMLLGPRRVEGVERGPGGLRVIVRCHCDTVLVWSADQGAVPGPSSTPRDAPVAEPRPVPARPEAQAQLSHHRR